MFWTSKKKREQEQFAIKMMKAAAEGAERARAVRAMATVGIKIESNLDQDKFCVRSVVAIVIDLAERAGQKPIWLDDDRRFTAGIFAFTLANAMTYRLGASFEVVAYGATLMLTAVGDDHAADARDVEDIIDAYNEHSQPGRASHTIGTLFSKWLVEPTAENLGKLVALYKLLGEHVGPKGG